MTPTWTEDRVDLLKKLWESGLSCSQIAAELGHVTRNAVIGKVHRLGLGGRVDKEKAQNIATRRSVRSGSTTPKRTTVLRNVLREQPAEASVDQDEDRHGSATDFDPSVPESQRKSVADLEIGDCRWPHGDPQTAEFFFCGKRSMQDDLPYCAHHSRLAYAAAGERRLNLSPEEHARRVALGKKMAARNKARRLSA